MEEPKPNISAKDFLIGEHRCWPRIQTSLTALYADPLGSFREERVSNLSKGGLFLNTSKPLPKGEQLELILLLPDQTCEIAVSGQVMHSHYPREIRSSDETPGMGIMFTTVEPNLKNTLGNFIDRLLQTEGGGKRIEPRVHSPPCKIQINAAKGKQGAILTNISKNGMFIRTENPLNLFEHVHTCITHPETYFDLELEGEVAHIKKIDSHSYSFGAGIHFLNLDPDTENAVLEIVREIMLRQRINDPESFRSH